MFLKYFKNKILKHTIKIISEIPIMLTILKLVRNANAKEMPKKNSILIF